MIEPEPFGPTRIFELKATTTEGVISMTGTDIDSLPVLQTGDGALCVTGELTAELRRLSGARISVEGERRAGWMPGESIEVSRDSVLEVTASGRRSARSRCAMARRGSLVPTRSG